MKLFQGLIILYLFAVIQCSGVSRVLLDTPAVCGNPCKEKCCAQDEGCAYDDKNSLCVPEDMMEQPKPEKSKPKPEKDEVKIVIVEKKPKEKKRKCTTCGPYCCEPGWKCKEGEKGFECLAPELKDCTPCPGVIYKAQCCPSGTKCVKRLVLGSKCKGRILIELGVKKPKCDKVVCGKRCCDKEGYVCKNKKCVCAIPCGFSCCKKGSYCHRTPYADFCTVVQPDAVTTAPKPEYEAVKDN